MEEEWGDVDFASLKVKLADKTKINQRQASPITRKKAPGLAQGEDRLASQTSPVSQIKNTGSANASADIQFANVRETRSRTQLERSGAAAAIKPASGGRPMTPSTVTEKATLRSNQLRQRLEQASKATRRGHSTLHNIGVACTTDVDDDPSWNDVEMNMEKLRNFKSKLGNREQTTTVDSENEYWTEDSLGIRHADKRGRGTRVSTGSSNLSLSIASTVDSEELLDGLELPAASSNLRSRLRQTTQARAAGDTIRVRKGKVFEDILDGLELEGELGVRGTHSNIKRSPKSTRRTREVANVQKSNLIGSQKSAQFGQDQAGPDYGRRLTRKISNLAIQSSESNSSLSRKSSRTDLRKAEQSSAREYEKARGRSGEKSSRPAFLPGGSTSSHHVTNISGRQLRTEGVSASNRPSRSTPSPTKRRATASEALRNEAAKQSTFTHTRARTFGDGHELDDIDDLPLDTATIRAKSQINISKPQSKKIDISTYAERPKRTHADPRQATSTLATLRQPRPTSRPSPTNITGQKRRKPQLPLLISNLNATGSKKSVNNMHYNPQTFRWDGNDEDSQLFDSVTSPPRPALISNITQAKGIQVINGMVFDPEQMCWIKLQEGEEDDPFADLKDLEDEAPSSSSGQTHGVRTGEFSVGEEFDVGPSFIRRQREEEIIWRKHMHHWSRPSTTSQRRVQLYEIYNLLLED